VSGFCPSLNNGVTIPSLARRVRPPVTFDMPAIIVIVVILAIIAGILWRKPGNSE